MEGTAVQSLLIFFAQQYPAAAAALLFSVIGSPLAVTVIVLVTWIKDGRRRAEAKKEQAVLLEAYRADTQEVLKSYGDHVNQLAAYYERNVELVKSWQQIAEGFRDTVVLNTTTITKLCDSIETNQYCPHVRINKHAHGPQG